MKTIGITITLAVLGLSTSLLGIASFAAAADNCSAETALALVGTSQGDAEYVAACDADGDGVITLADVSKTLTDSD